YLPLAKRDDADLGWSDVDYDLPNDTGTFTTTCQSNPSIEESDTVSITSYVVVDINDVEFKATSPASLPPTPLTDLISLDPNLPSNPSVSVPPDSPQLPDYPGLDERTAKLAPRTTPSGSGPLVGIIGIRCPRRDRRCEGTLSATAIGGVPRGVLGRRAYSVPAGENEILNLRLASSAGAVLNRAGRLRVRVIVNSDVIPGSHRSAGHRTVLL